MKSKLLFLIFCISYSISIGQINKIHTYNISRTIDSVNSKTILLSSNNKGQDNNIFKLIDVYPPLIAVITAWLLAYFPQRKQNFEHTFFELLKNQNEILYRISFDISDNRNVIGNINTKGNGLEYFIYAEFKLKQLYNFISQDFLKKSIIQPGNKQLIIDECDGAAFDIFNSLMSLEELKLFYANRPKLRENESETEFDKRKSEHVYNYFFEKHGLFVGHYFRHLFNVLKFIEKHSVVFYWKAKFYTGLVQAQMSAPELFVLFYNGLKFEKMEKYINKYKLIENLAVEDLILPGHERFYKKVKMKHKNST